MSEIKRTADGRIAYEPDGVRLCAFITSSNFVDVIQGPLGSGKSKGCCLRIGRHAMEQRPSPIDGLRKTRWAIVRNTFPDLKRTTIRTWLEVFDEGTYGRFNWGQPPAHNIAFGDVRMQVDFLALDKAEDIRKLRSGEYTGIWFNEVQYSEKTLFDEAQSRVDRYPSRAEGGPTWTGVIADANAPDEDHWLGMMTGQVDLPEGLSDDQRAEYAWPPEWGFFKQPSALIELTDHHGRIIGYEVNPQAENRRWLNEGYYERQRTGKTKAWIDSRLMNRIALVVDGSPVWPAFKADVHVSPEVLKPVPNHIVYVGMDFGNTPAAVLGQAVNNRVVIQHELLPEPGGALAFAPRLRRALMQHYGHLARPGEELPQHVIYGDPKGHDKPQSGERTSFDIMRAHGLPARAAPVKQNDITTRVAAVAYVLEQLYDGRPRFVLSPACRSLKVAMAGRYHLEREETGELKPKKDRYSHLADALQYMVLGMGEGRSMVGQSAAPSNRVIVPKKKSRRRV